MKHPVPFTPGLMFPKFWLRLKLSILCCIQKLKMCFYSGYDFTQVENKYITVSRIWCFLQRQRTNPSSTSYRTAFSVPSQEAKCIFKTYKITCLHFISVLFFHGSNFFFYFLKKKVVTAPLHCVLIVPSLLPNSDTTVFLTRQNNICKTSFTDILKLISMFKIMTLHF